MSRDVYSMLAEQLRAQGWLRRSMFILATVGAAAAGVISIYPRPEDGFPIWVLVLQALGLISAGVVPLLFAFAEKTPEDLVRELGEQTTARGVAEAARVEAERDRDAIKGAFRGSVVLYVTAQAISEATDAVMLAPSEARREVARRQLYSVLDRLIENKFELFGMNDDRWTFGIYVPENEQLILAVTRRWSRESELGEHRAWEPGEGHVGQAFKARRELVCADSRAREVAGFMEASGGNYREYDRELYISFASVPLMIGDREEPLGILVATSDQAGRFVPPDGDDGTRDTVEPLRLAADVLASILFLTANDGSWLPMGDGETNAGR